MAKKNDYFYSLLTVIIPMLFIQLLMIPLYSKIITQDQFGKFLLVLAVINMSSAILGNSLNNIRLTYKEEKDNENDFLSFLLILFLPQILISIIISSYLELSILSVMFITLWSLLLLIKTYLYVYYRLNLNYKIYFTSAMVGLISLVIGFIFVYKFHANIWIAYTLSDLFSIVYIIYSLRSYKKKFSFVALEKGLRKKYFSLVNANIFNNLAIYSDRLLISIILGTTYVPLFFIATTLGKMSNVIITPISNVLLSYSVKENEAADFKKELQYLIQLLILILIMNVFVTIGSFYFIKIFYSSYLDQVGGILWWSNLSVLLFASTSLPQVKLIAKEKYNFNLIINIIVVLLLILSIPIIKSWGLLGYSVALIITSLVKHILIQYFIFKK